MEATLEKLRLSSLTRFIEPLRKAFDYVPLTPLGIVLGLVAWWGFFSFSETHADYVVRATCAVALGLIGLSVVLVGFGSLFLWWRTREAEGGVPETLATGVEAETSFSCSTLRFWPFLQVDLDWTDPTGMDVTSIRKRGRLQERVTPRSRGRFTSVERRFEVRDIFGFSAVRFRRRWEQPLRIAPTLGKADMELSVRRASSDGYSHPAGQPQGEMVEMRRYVPGDPMRFILWKSFARSRRLMVREPERAIAPRPAMVGFFVAARDDEPSASTARVFLERGLLGSDFVFLAEGAPRATNDRRDGVEQIIDSRKHRDTQADSLTSLFRTVDRARLDNLVIFAPPSRGPWLDKVLKAARQLPLPPMVIVTVDGAVTNFETRTRLSKFIWGEPPIDPTLTEVVDVVAALEQSGMEVKVLHRQSGHRLHDQQLHALRERQ